MKTTIYFLIGHLVLGVSMPAAAQFAGKLATQGAFTSHGGQVTGGSANVLYGGAVPVARVGDPATCPLACGDEQPHVGGVIANGSSSVFVNGLPAAVSGVSQVPESCATSSVLSGVPNINVAP